MRIELTSMGLQSSTCPTGSTYINWCGWRDSNSQNLDFESSTYTNSITSAWWAERELNSHSTDYESAALPLSYQPNIWRRVWESNPLTVSLRWQISNLLHYRPAHSPLIVTVLKTHSTTLLLNVLQNVFKQDGSEVCLFDAHRVVPWINYATHPLVFKHNSVAM